MALVRTDPSEPGEYTVDLETAPAAVRAGEPFTLRLTVRRPPSRAVVSDFATVHEKRFHLFVISQDLEHYEHVHPEQDADGSWTLPLTLPRPGHYRLYSDFLPAGGAPQVVALSLETAGLRADTASLPAKLVPDRSLTKSVGNMQASLTFAEPALVAGREATLSLELSDRRTGAPVEDLQVYLGAWGHALLVSEDLLSMVHAHPVESVPPEDASARGGPVVTFKAHFPKPGHYRLWIQLKRGDALSTAVFTLSVASPAAD
jgi:hypothetical protein